MTFTRSRLAVAAVALAACTATPAAASADSLPATYRSDAAQSGGSVPSSRSDAAQSGAESASVSTFPAADFRGGDTPADHPGASRAVTAVPATIEVVRPERTVVRDVDEALPVILSGAALLLALAGLAIALGRTRFTPRPGGSH